ncbi:MAG TPA: spore germination protein, partial [Limnochordia bacterium]
VILASSLGLFGVIVGVMVLCLHLVNLRSFGTPYLEPVVPPRPAEWKDVFVRVPMWAHQHRPRLGRRRGGTRRQASRGDHSAGRSRAVRTSEAETSARRTPSRWR